MSNTICEHEVPGIPVLACDIVTKATFKKLGQTLSGPIVVNLLTNFKDDSGMTLEHRVEIESQVRPIYPKTQFHSSVPSDQVFFEIKLNLKAYILKILLFATSSSTGLIYRSKVNGPFWLSSSSPSDTYFCSIRAVTRPRRGKKVRAPKTRAARGVWGQAPAQKILKYRSSETLF